MKYFFKGLIVFIFLCSSLFGAGYIGSDGPTYNMKGFLESDLSELRTGLIVPKDWQKKAQLKKLDSLELYQGDLPEKFDWRDYGLTPIRNQGNCGSCWAFSMTATVADVYKLFNLQGFEDLSEQYLVSCQDEYYGCSGGWMEFRMFKQYGSVLEKDFPYQARNLPCPNNLTYHHKINDWFYVDSQSAIPATELLKRIIYTYGPISVAVSVNSNFSRYSDGIFNDSETGTVNHAVNLVGWDDTVKPAHWIMRNSWGSSWGNGGWMKIAYKSRKIGYAATYIDYQGEITPNPDPTPTPDPSPTPTPTPTPDPDPDPQPFHFPWWAWLIVGGLIAVVLFLSVR